jgi:hypothetical protein
LGRHPASTDGSKRIHPRPTDAAIERQILSRVGKPVHFRYPGTEGPRHGVLKDRVVIQSSSSAQGVLYWDVVDLIEFPEAPEPLWMRVGYYRHANGRLVWGSQTTLTDPLSAWQRLFTAAKTRSWFAPLVRI